jgi:hypothetical protein
MMEHALLFNRLLRFIKEKKCKEPHQGLIVCSIDFHEPYLTCLDIDLISLAAWTLLIEYAYPTINGYSNRIEIPHCLCRYQTHSTSGD